MLTALIVRPFPSLLTFEEQLLCRGAAQCGVSGLVFIEKTVREAIWRYDLNEFRMPSDSACNLLDASV